MDYAKLPKVDQVAARVSEQLPGGGVRVLLTRAARQAVDALRQAGFLGEATREELYARAAEHALACYRTLARPSLRRVINATGVVLHTNLGRAPLAPEAARAAELAAGYCSLELDLEEGRRGSRYSHVAALIAELTGAEDALVVNNNAAAVLLVLDTLARGGEAVASVFPRSLSGAGPSCGRWGPPTGPACPTTRTPSEREPPACSRCTPAIFIWKDLWRRSPRRSCPPWPMPTICP